jgi:hypothetical protein
MLIDPTERKTPRRSIIYCWKIASTMDAPRLASLKGACADPASRRKHPGDFAFASPTAAVGATPPRRAEGPTRVVEARKRVLQTPCVPREVAFERKHRSLRDRNVVGRLSRVDCGPGFAVPFVRCLRPPLMGVRPKRTGVRRGRAPCSEAGGDRPSRVGTAAAACCANHRLARRGVPSRKTVPELMSRHQRRS